MPAGPTTNKCVLGSCTSFGFVIVLLWDCVVCSQGSRLWCVFTLKLCDEAVVCVHLELCDEAVVCVHLKAV